MKILISNDDGVFAPGILAAKQAVEDLADVTVVAPDRNNSSVGRRISLFKHLKINSCELEDGSPAYSVSGSPADAVIVGVDYVMDEKPDCVINIVDATNLERNLYLTTQLLEMDICIQTLVKHRF